MALQLLRGPGEVGSVSGRVCASVYTANAFAFSSSPGIDIDAGCGQLSTELNRAKKKKETQEAKESQDPWNGEVETSISSMTDK